MNAARRRSFAARSPDLPMTLSSAVAPEIREFERISTACANAYVQPRMQRYLAKLEASLAAMGVTGALYVMLSAAALLPCRRQRITRSG
jgi:N-methylhydantoinase A